MGWDVMGWVLEKIPIGFLKYLKGQEQEHVVLRRAGKKWLVKLNGQRLEEGWEKFVEEHDLQLGDLLVFRHDGDMEFEVVIFDSSHCDREFVEHLQEEEAAHTIEEPSKKFEFKDKPDPQMVLSSKAFHHAKASTHNSSGQSHVEFTVKSYCLSNGYFHLPKKFAAANGLTNKKCGLIIRDGRQRSWKFKILTSGCHIYVGGRWGKFCAANAIKVGDHIRFEVVTGGEEPIWNFHVSVDYVSSIEKLDMKGSLSPKVKKTRTSGVTAAMSQVLASTSTDDDANPHFISTIKPYITTNPVLYLPMTFAKSNGLMNRTEMILVDEKRRSWSVQLGATGSHFVIKRQGWTKFMKANGVRVGDTYKFELINNGTIPIAYFHCDLRPLTGGRVIEGSWGINFFYSFMTVIFGPACVGLHSSTMYLLYLLVATSN